MMKQPTHPIILIPARLASTRLPNKPLAMIGDAPMIVEVWRRAVASGIGDVVVACDTPAIQEVIEAAGGKAVLTDPDLPSGSDRIYAALSQIDPNKHYDLVINVQGDMPTLDPAIIATAARLLDNPDVDIGTLAAVITDDSELADSAIVKVALGQRPEARGNSEKTHASCLMPHAYKAISFSRQMHGNPPYYHHIGIYAYRREALEKFVALPPSANEQREKLEQLRAMDAGMRIDVSVVDTVPLGVDTPEGLEKARRIYATKL